MGGGCNPDVFIMHELPQWAEYLVIMICHYTSAQLLHILNTARRRTWSSYYAAFDIFLTNRFMCPWAWTYGKPCVLKACYCCWTLLPSGHIRALGISWHSILYMRCWSQLLCKTLEPQWQRAYRQVFTFMKFSRSNVLFQIKTRIIHQNRSQKSKRCWFPTRSWFPMQCVRAVRVSGQVYQVICLAKQNHRGTLPARPSVLTLQYLQH